MQTRKTISIYLGLLTVWLLIAGWQTAEHFRFRSVAYQAMLERGREIVSTMGVVIRSQGRFGLVQKTRLEAALEELSRSTDLQAVMLLNASGQVVASAGEPVNLDPKNPPHKEPFWDRKRNLLTIMDLVDLGANTQNDANIPRAIVMSEDMIDTRTMRRMPPPPPPPFPDGPQNDDDPSSPSRFSRFRGHDHEPDGDTSSSWRQRRMRHFGEPGPGMGMGPGRADMGATISRPFWMSQQRFNELMQKAGLHGFILQLPTQRLSAIYRYDLWVRITTTGVALLAVIGLGLAWRSLERMNQLQLRLLRAREINNHLRELNIAAAGLAHETRNPLNIVRGFAQLISQGQQVPDEIRQKAGVITEEVDRITGRLNQFISYSRSPEPRTGPTRLEAVVQDVQRALESDLAEKEIKLDMAGLGLAIDADESLLRQVIFNLLLNACQSVGRGGHIQVEFIVQNVTGALEISDDGPGVPPELHADIFRPYFTTRAEGTGLGLAVVKQIVLAHQWEIDYSATRQPGAAIRISGMKIVQ